MRQWTALALSLAGLVASAAISRRQEQPAQYPDYSLLAECPGYVASNVEKSGSGLRADLKLDGEACNAYGEDLKDLTLEVTFESSE